MPVMPLATVPGRAVGTMGAMPRLITVETGIVSPISATPVVPVRTVFAVFAA
jgi:hypothetical protein